jgi:hypothetical protein
MFDFSFLIAFDNLLLCSSVSPGRQGVLNFQSHLQRSPTLIIAAALVRDSSITL